MQQDAEECWTSILASLRNKLRVSACWGVTARRQQLRRACSLRNKLRVGDGAACCLPPGLQSSWPPRARGPAARRSRGRRRRARSALHPPTHPPTSPASPAPQDGPSADPTIRKLFGVKLHTSLKATEGDEAIEARP